MNSAALYSPPTSKPARPGSPPPPDSCAPLSVVKTKTVLSHRPCFLSEATMRAMASSMCVAMALPGESATGLQGGRHQAERRLDEGSTATLLARSQHPAPWHLMVLRQGSAICGYMSMYFCSSWMGSWILSRCTRSVGWKRKGWWGRQHTTRGHDPGARPGRRVPLCHRQRRCPHKRQCA